MDTKKEMKQGHIMSLFPNLKLKVIANGCICEIITISEQQIQCKVVDAFNSNYKIGTQFWVTNFLIN